MNVAKTTKASARHQGLCVFPHVLQCAVLHFAALGVTPGSDARKTDRRIGDFCNRRSIKCSSSSSGDALGRCQNCVDFDVACTFDRPAKRRGVKAGSRVTRDAPVAKAISDHSPVVPVPVLDRGERSSASRSSMVPDSGGPRPSWTGDPWTAFNTGWSTTEGYDDDGALRNSWKAFAIASDQQIRNLVQVYFEIVYPM